MSNTHLDRPKRPVTLLPTNQVSDFSRNFLEMEHRAKRPYSLTKFLEVAADERGMALAARPGLKVER